MLILFVLNEIIQFRIDLNYLCSMNIDEEKVNDIFDKLDRISMLNYFYNEKENKKNF